MVIPESPKILLHVGGVESSGDLRSPIVSDSSAQ